MLADPLKRYRASERNAVAIDRIAIANDPVAEEG